MLFKKGDAALIFIGIVISAYMTVSYDMTYKLLTEKNTNIAPIAIAGMISLGVGALLFYLFIRGKVKSND